MRLWTIVLFIVAIHAALAIINVGNITDIGLDMSIDTTSKTGVIVSQGNPGGIEMPSSDPRFFCQTAKGAGISRTNKTVLGAGDYVGKFIESIINLGGVFAKFMSTFGHAIFGIHTLTAPLFGEFNSWVLEGMVDFLVVIGFFQIMTGRSFKTMD